MLESTDSKEDYNAMDACVADEAKEDVGDDGDEDDMLSGSDLGNDSKHDEKALAKDGENEEQDGVMNDDGSLGSELGVNPALPRANNLESTWIHTRLLAPELPGRARNLTCKEAQRQER